MTLNFPSAISDQRSAVSDQRSSLSVFVPFLVGSVLLAAALLKIQRLWTDSPGASGIFESTWFQVILVEAELAGGFALWLGFWPRVVRWSAMLMFAAFFGAALAQALGGARSCACFGNVDLHPWFAVLLDVGMLAALFPWRPQRSEIANPPFFAGRCAAIIPIGALLLFPVALLAIGQPNMGAAPRLITTPSTLQLGIVPKGGYKQVAFSLENQGQSPVEIASIESTCPCFAVRFEKRILGPGQESSAWALLDMSLEPNFTGELRPTAKGLDGNGKTVFHLSARAVVQGARAAE